MTLKQQAEKFMAQIQTRRRNPVKAATVAAYQSFLDKWILPSLGNEELSQIGNGTVKNFTKKLTEAGLSTATINNIFCVIKMIVASAVDENGDVLFPRTWNREFMDIPTIDKANQEAPYITPETITEAISRGLGQEKALYALLAGTGLRIGESLSLMIGPDDGKHSFWDPQTGTITIRTTVSQGDIQFSPKTEAGTRQVDLAPELNAFLKKTLDLEPGLLFRSLHGDLAIVSTLLRHAHKAGVPGFHSFRRFRLTHLENNNVPRMLTKFWAGHAAGDISERYMKNGQDIETRKTWARKAGLGFALEAA